MSSRKILRICSVALGRPHNKHLHGREVENLIYSLQQSSKHVKLERWYSSVSIQNPRMLPAARVPHLTAAEFIVLGGLAARDGNVLKEYKS